MGAPLTGFGASARQEARRILAQPPYTTRPSRPFRPLAGVLHAIGRALDWLFGRPASWLYHHLLVHLGHGFSATFGNWWPLVLGAMALGAGALLGIGLVRRRTRVGPAPPAGTEHAADTDESAAELVQQADLAEAAGDHEQAVRLRFRAGLLQLEARGAIANRHVQTDRQLSRQLSSPTFARLAERHEEIVYAGDVANQSDAEAARAGWPRVLSEARGRR